MVFVIESLELSQCADAMNTQFGISKPKVMHELLV